MPKMSPQVTIAAVASALALAALAISAPVIENGMEKGGPVLIPAMADVPMPHLPTFDIVPF